MIFYTSKQTYKKTQMAGSVGWGVGWYQSCRHSGSQGFPLNHRGPALCYRLLQSNNLHKASRRLLKVVIVVFPRVGGSGYARGCGHFQNIGDCLICFKKASCSFNNFVDIQLFSQEMVLQGIVQQKLTEIQIRSQTIGIGGRAGQETN